MLPALIALSILLALALFLSIWLWTDRRALRIDRDRIASDRATLEDTNLQHLQKLQAQQQSIHDLETKAQLAQQREHSLTEQFEQAQQQARDTFKALASDTLRQSLTDFQKQAEQLFKSEHDKSDKALQANQQAVQNLVKPVAESLTQYQKALQEAEQARNKALGSLSAETHALSQAQQLLNQQTANLVKALRRPEVRGRWGELQLDRLFQLAGMSEHFDYDPQATVTADDGSSIRPDYTVHLPNDRTVVIDVKTPIDAYLSATEQTDDQIRATHLQDHARQIDRACKNLATKKYWAACPGSPDFVIMFVPAESILDAAVQQDPQLIERALTQNVILATPTIMIALLRIIALAWREKSLSDNAARIADLGRDLANRIRVALNHFATLGSNLHKAAESYNRMASSINRNLLPTTRKFEQLGINPDQSLPENISEIQSHFDIISSEDNSHD